MMKRYDKILLLIAITYTAGTLFCYYDIYANESPKEPTELQQKNPSYKPFKKDLKPFQTVMKDKFRYVNTTSLQRSELLSHYVNTDVEMYLGIHDIDDNLEITCYIKYLYPHSAAIIINSDLSKKELLKFNKGSGICVEGKVTRIENDIVYIKAKKVERCGIGIREED